MNKVLTFLLFLTINSSYAQQIPAETDSAINKLRSGKTIYKDIDLKKVAIAPAYLDVSSVKLYREDLLFFSFKENPSANSKLDSTLLKKNPGYLHYALGQHGNKRGFYYRGKFQTLDIHHNYLEGLQLGLDTCFVHLDTAILIAGRNYRYVFTQWKPSLAADTGYHNMTIVFTFNKNNKLINHIAYDNPGLSLSSSVGFFNKDDLLDVLFQEESGLKYGQPVQYLGLYSINKKGKFVKRKFYKGGYTIAIMGS